MSKGLETRIDAVDAAFQNLKNAISGYTATNEHTERKYGDVSFLSGLMSIENELTKIRDQVELYRISAAEKTDAPAEYKMSHKGKFFNTERDLTK